MIVQLFNYGKKRNSTSRPAGATATLFNNVQLKDETSTTQPVLLFNPASSGMQPFFPSKFNYAYIPQFSRFYFIDDWVFVNGLWECYLHTDVLASYHDSIGDLSEYILRSSYAYNGYISDVFYPAHTNPSISMSNLNIGLNTTGFYIIGIINNNSQPSTGAITYYFVSAAQMANIKSYLMSETFLSDKGLANLQEINKELVKVLYNPFQYIASCKFIPMDFPTVGTDEPIQFGWWQIPFSGRRMSQYGYTALKTVTFTPSAHPQSSRGTYLNHAPYTERYILHPLLGTIFLDSNKIDPGDTLDISIICDVVTGMATFTVNDSTKNIRIYQSTIQLAVDIQLAQINTDVIGMARTAVDSVGNIASSISRFDIAGAVTAAASGVLNTLEASIPILQTSGTNGNFSMFNLPANFIECFRQIVNEDLAHKGRPLCEVRQISTIPGYIVCSDAHAEITCFDSERLEIVNYLNNGFYYE